MHPLVEMLVHERIELALDGAIISSYPLMRNNHFVYPDPDAVKEWQKALIPAEPSAEKQDNKDNSFEAMAAEWVKEFGKK